LSSAYSIPIPLYLLSTYLSPNPPLLSTLNPLFSAELLWQQSCVLLYYNYLSTLLNPVGSCLNVSIYYPLASPKLCIIMYQPRYNKDYLPIDNKSDSTSNSDIDSLFDSSNNKVDTASNTDLDSPLEEVNSNTDNNNNLFDNKVQYLPEYYLAVSANLDIGQLQQKYYSFKIQGCLD
jgi:hypothetical protein